MRPRRTAPPMLLIFGLALAAAVPAAGQARDRPTLMLTIYGGLQTGRGLWAVERQPLSVPGDTRFDTLRVSRSVGPGLLAGVTATYFFLPQFGVHAQIGYEGFPLDDTCTMVHAEPDTDQRNAQLCNHITGSSVSGGAIHLSGGVVLRAAARGAMSPYVRAGVGIVNRPQSAVGMVGSYVTNGTIVTREVIADDTPHRTSVTAALGIGLTVPLSPGYQFRLELRDAVSQIERPAGAADAFGDPPTELTLFNSLALTIGLDIVLEQKRGRRY